MRILPLFIFWCLWVLNFSTRTVFSPILPLIEDNFGLSHGEAGSFFTSLSIGYGLALLIAGRFASIWGYKRMVVSGFLCPAVIFFTFQWVESYYALHVLFFLLGITAGTYIPSILPIITETYEYRHWGKVIGIHDSATSFSSFAIPILVAFGLHLFSWRMLLLFLGIASVILPIPFWKVSIEPKQATSRHDSHYSDLLKRKSVLIMCLLAIFGALASGVYYILPLYLIKERGIEFSFANTLFGISRMGGVFVAVSIGLLIDRYGYRTMLKLGIVMSGLSTIALSLSNTLPLIVVTLILQSAFSVAFFPVCFVTISKLTSLSERSMATGLVVFCGTISGIGVAPFLLGFIADHFNFKVGILGLGVLTTFTPILVRFLKEEGEKG
jgi:MFS family permease